MRVGPPHDLASTVVDESTGGRRGGLRTTRALAGDRPWARFEGRAELALERHILAGGAGAREGEAMARAAAQPLRPGLSGRATRPPARTHRVWYR